VTTQKKGWARSESRAVRPFKTAEDALADVALRLSDDSEFQIAEGVLLDSVHPERMSLTVRIPALSPHLASSVNVAKESLLLVVGIEDTVFKQSVVLESRRLADLEADETEIELARERYSMMSWSGDTNLFIALILAEAQQSQTGVAHRRGAWVSRKVFRFTRMRDTAHFAVTPVGPEYFKKLRLPADTPYLVEILDDDMNQSSENLPDLLKIHIAESLYRTLAAEEDSPAAKLQMKAIYVDVVVSVLVAGYGELGNDDVLQDGILDVITRRLAKSNGVSEQVIRQNARRSAGVFLRPFAQADAELLKMMVAAAQRRS